MKKSKRKKIPILNILFLVLMISLISSLVFKNRENFKNIFTNKNKIKAPQASKADKLEIGDIVYYNHKDVIKQKSEDPAVQEKYNKMQKDHEANQTVTIPVGDSANPGSGYGTSDQTFNAKDYNTTWRVWDKLSDGRVMLVSNKTVARIYTKGAVGHIWWEHNAHKVSSIFGYGEGADVGITDTGEEIGANKAFSYKVGSGIDSAPDMNEGDKGDWKIGEEPQDKINISAARSLTLPEVEKKLGITKEKINDSTYGFSTNKSGGNGGPYYGNPTTTSMTYVVQRDIGSPNQDWTGGDKTSGKAKNKSYTMTDGYYYWDKDKIPATKYKDMLFNGINNWNGLATNALDVSTSGSSVSFLRGLVDSSALDSAGFAFVNSSSSYWYEYEDSPSLRVAVYLKSNLDYYEAKGEEEKVELEGTTTTGEWGKIKVQAWDLQVPETKEKKIEIENYQKLDFEPQINLVQNEKKINANKENNRYIANVTYEEGVKRNGIGDNAEFVDGIHNAKYNLEISNLPAGYTFKIEGQNTKEIDVSQKDNIRITIYKDGQDLPARDMDANDLHIGDIVYYNHKDVIKQKSEDPTMQEKYNKMQKDHEANQTVTIKKGSASIPGHGLHTEKKDSDKTNKDVDAKNKNNDINDPDDPDDPDKPDKPDHKYPYDGIYFNESYEPESNPQTFSAKNYNTTWRVWDKLPDGRLILISNRPVVNFKTGNPIGYIWWEHNAHRIASIFGYGEGADINATQSFPYKVGSGIEDAPDMTEGDKGEWKIGENGIYTSGARALTLKDIDHKLGITEDFKKKNYFFYGANIINKKSDRITIPQREIKENQEWENRGAKNFAVMWNKDFKLTNKKFNYNKINNNNVYLKILNSNLHINNETTPAIATNLITGPGIDAQDIVYFTCEDLINYQYYIDHGGTKMFYYSQYLGSAEGNEKKLSLKIIATLKPNIKYLPAGANAWDIYKPNSEDKNIKLKVLNLSLASIDEIGIKASKANTEGVLPEDVSKETKISTKVDEKYEYNLNIKKFDGQKRNKNTTGDNATFSRIDNIYNVEITGIPEGYDFKIIGKTGKQIDLDTDTNLEYELVIYPKAGTQNIQVEYVGGEYDKSDENDSNFVVTGNVVIKYGKEELGRKNGVTLKRGVNSVPVDNVDLFDKTKNDLKEYTVEFEKTDTSLHTVAFDPDTKKLVVTYVSPKREITISVVEDSKKYLTNISEIKLKLVGGEEKNITLKPKDYTFKLTVPERDEDGNPINYSLQKVENIPGYYLSIDEFNVNFKPILKLPYTGTELSGKNIAIISLGIFGIALAIRFRKKLVLVFKEYTMMK